MTDKLIDIRDIVTPLWKLSYNNTLYIKNNKLKSLLISLYNDINKNNKYHYWLKQYNHIVDLENRNINMNDINEKFNNSNQNKFKKHKTNNNINLKNELACLYHGIVPSPIQSGYRNKCEFTVGLNEEKLITAGYNSGRFVDGCFNVKSPNECINIPDIAKFLAEKFNVCVRQPINDIYLTSYDKETQKGFWRLLTVRNAETSKEVMLIIQTKSSTNNENLTIEDVQNYILN